MYLRSLLIGIFFSVKCCHCTQAGKFYLYQGPRGFTPRPNFIQATTLEKGTDANFKLLTQCTTLVDKTNMIADLFECNENHHHVITCPRRFGKSTNLDMIKRFAQIPIDPVTRKMKNITKLESHKLFNNSQLAIYGKETIFENHFGKYFVIRINFGNMKSRTFEETLDHIRTRLVTCYLEYVWLYLELEQRYHEEKDLEKRSLMEQNYHLLDKIFQHNITEMEITRGLGLICELVNELSSGKIILLIDDLDAPLMNALAMNFSLRRTYDLMDQMISNVFGNQNIHLAYSIITGTSHKILSSLTSKFNYFTYHRFLDDHLFANSFGFDEKELTQLFEHHRIPDEERADFKRRFFGYTTRTKKLNVYNTYAVIQFFTERTIEPPTSDETLSNYWAETGSILDNGNFLAVASIRNLITQLMCRDQIKIQLKDPNPNFITQFEELQKIAIGNYEILTQDHVSLFFDFFFEHGYLSHSAKPDYFRIPNYEIIQHFQRQLKSFYDKKFPKLRTKFVANNLSTVLYLEYPSALQLTDLEISFNELFDMIWLKDLPSYEFVRNQWEFVSLLSWVSLNFIEYFYKVEIGIDLNPVENGTTEVAHAHIMFWSRGQRLILLLQTVSNQDFIAALDQIQGYVPVNEKSDVVKYLGINVNENFTIEVGDGTNHGVLKLKPGETGFDFEAGYSIFKQK